MARELSRNRQEIGETHDLNMTETIDKEAHTISLTAVLDFLGDSFGEPEVYEKFFVYVMSFGGGRDLFDNGKGIAITTERDPTKIDIVLATKSDHWSSSEEKIIRTVDLCRPDSFEEIKQTLARELVESRK